MSRLALIMLLGFSAGVSSVPGVAHEPTGAPAASAAKSVFTAAEVAAYKPKGATKCFRQLCYDYNWTSGGWPTCRKSSPRPTR